MGGANTTDAGFQQWKQQYAPNDQGTDYDLKGAYAAGLKPSGANGHFTDTFKLPNHPTFSSESKYSTPEKPGGVWGVDASGKDTFTPSAWMAADKNRMETLKKYFAEREKNSVLIFPQQQKQANIGNMGGSQSPKNDQNLTDYSRPTPPASPLAKKVDSYYKQNEGKQLEQASTLFSNQDAPAIGSTHTKMGRDISPGQFKGVSSKKQKPSLINTTAEEAMGVLD